MKFPFDPSHGLIVVRTRITGPAGDATAQLVLDTGAAKTMLPPGLLASVGIDVASAREFASIVTASHTISLPIIRVQSLEALGRVSKGLEVVCGELPRTARVEGVLGLDVLGSGSLFIDFARHTISLES